VGIKEYREIIFSALKYEPTEAQGVVFEDGHRVRLVAGGWRAGKSHVGAKEVILQVPRSKLIWLIGKNYSTCRQEFEYVYQDLLRLQLVVAKEISFPKEGPCSLKAINGCRIETKSAEDSEKIGMSAPDFILVCEAAQVDYDAYLRIRGRIAERDGSIMLTGTFEGSLGWYPEYYKRGQAFDPELKSFSLPSWTNTVIFPGGRNDPKILAMEAEIGPLFTEYCAAVPCAPSGIILPEFSNAVHVGDYPYDPGIPVEIAVDPGYGGAYAVMAMQIKESIPYIVDEIYLQGYTTEDIITIVKQKPWGNKLQSGAIDIAGRQHQAMAAPIEVWREKLGLYLESKYVDVEGGIELLRTFLAVNPLTNHPKLYVHNGCHGFISECGGCKSPLSGGGVWLRDTNTGKIIDKNNHATKAVIYWLVNRFGYTAKSYQNDFGRTFKLDGKQTGSVSEWRKKILMGL
jgi:hypothetical protein